MTIRCECLNDYEAMLVSDRLVKTLQERGEADLNLFGKVNEESL
ncbi:hypothetical protein [Methyloceanibacter stevinii]|nr:hypothetical protein [Methyloceanibacter stevinii]